MMRGVVCPVTAKKGMGGEWVENGVENGMGLCGMRIYNILLWLEVVSFIPSRE